MLSPNDIHYIVGLLVVGFESDNNIDFELGTALFDEVTEENRDIDITITYKDTEGKYFALKGIEVKHHARPLTAEQVEQLCAKFKDIPAITQRGIVSSSGYTKGAIKKALHNNVELFYLEKWENPNIEKIGNVGIEKDLKVSQRIYYWHKNFPQHEIIFAKSPTIKINLEQVTSLYSNDQKYRIPDLTSLFTILDQATLQNFIKDSKVSNTLASNETKFANVTVNMKDSVYLIYNNEKHFIDKIRIQGSIICIETNLSPEFKILRKYGEDKPFIGCAIMESNEFGLIGINISQKDTIISQNFFQVNVNNRLKKKIYREKFDRF